ncbi:M20 family metallo-hydrolase [Terracidiphilus gabretensis]|uniref:M20 family metallo-hydrolase n=1 Tax=Terracidiphilus gabretensis TaxID=1577687 RepID=UPI00071BDE15|nr:M20 family metallo-hydrolase [Terracidiphilus gabretensis]
MAPTLTTDNLIHELLTLGQISEAEPPVVTRVVFSEADLRARAYVKNLCTAAGLTIHEDPIGNTFARWPGSDPSLAPIGTGSHIDAIPNAGLYDGCVGVLGGLEAIRVLQALGFTPRRSIELVIFTSEEPTRFGIGCLGSRMISGALSLQKAATLRDKEGRTLDELRAAANFPGSLESVALPPNRFHQFIELHIEQGPTLEAESIDIGLVAHIAAPASLRILIEGEGGHAGAMLMPVRRDALAAASEIILAVESASKSTGVVDTVATVGVCEVFPGAVNSVPSRVKLEVDVRDIDATRRDHVLTEIQSACNQTASKRNVRITTEIVNSDPPATCDESILAALEDACKASGKSYRRMVSRAYHDSLFIARIAPVAMLFIPCRGGVSHRPDEYASPEWIGSGVHVLARTLAALAS